MPVRNDTPPETGVWKRGIWACLAERVGLDAFVARGAAKRVPIHRMTVFYFLGGMALFLFVVQVVTGLLLSLYYKPSPDRAFQSVQAIMTEVDFGWLIRSAHVWGANLAIGVLFLHVLTTYMMRAYRRGRETTWLTGILLLALFMAFGFTGYLLPWNTLSFFATEAGTELMGKVPLVGDQLLLVARSGENVTGDTLCRFYALHVALFPLVALGLMGLHLYLVQEQGLSIPDRVARRFGGNDNVPSMPLLPHFLLRDCVGWYLALAILAALAALVPTALGEKADPFQLPPAVKQVWYFLFIYQALQCLPRYVLGLESEVAGILFFGGATAAVLLVPLLDRGPRSRRILNCLAGPAVLFFIVTTAWGFFDHLGLRMILGSALLLGTLLLAFPLTDLGRFPHRELRITATLVGALLIVSIVDAVWTLHIWDGLANWLL